LGEETDLLIKLNSATLPQTLSLFRGITCLSSLTEPNSFFVLYGKLMSPLNPDKLLMFLYSSVEWLKECLHLILI